MSSWSSAAAALHRGVVDTLGEGVRVRTVGGERFVAVASWQRESDETDDQGVITVFGVEAEWPRPIQANDLIEVENEVYRVTGEFERRDGGVQLKAVRIDKRGGARL